jgi:hypothetical protein
MVLSSMVRSMSFVKSGCLASDSRTLSGQRVRTNSVVREAHLKSLQYDRETLFLARPTRSVGYLTLVLRNYDFGFNRSQRSVIPHCETPRQARESAELRQRKT